MKLEGTKYIVARNDWCANKIAKRIVEKRAPKELLFGTKSEAIAAMKKLPPLLQEVRNVFEIKFHV